MMYDSAQGAAPLGIRRTKPGAKHFAVAALIGLFPLSLAMAPAYKPYGAVEGWSGPLDAFDPAPDAAPALDGNVTRVAVSAAGDLYALFLDRGFRLEPARAGGESVPRVIVEKLPRDLAEVDSTDIRKSVFLKSLLPLVLLENERILADRDRLEAIVATDGPANASERDFLAELADRYETAPDQTRELLRRVDTIPVSLALAQAALESGWGTSRGAQSGQALFGQMTYRLDDDGRVRRFADLAGAVEAYALNLNTHRAYTEFRRARAAARAGGKPLDGHALAQHLQRYSERRMDYVRDVRGLMRANSLRGFDQARLDQAG
jgi:Bax protein